MSVTRTALHALLPLALCAASTGWAQAPTTPPGFVASPEVYKVIAENDKYRIVEVTWKAGQKDKSHSHPDAGVYNVTTCTLRSTLGNGGARESTNLAGAARINGPIASHTIENIGSTDCKVIMFEPK